MNIENQNIENFIVQGSTASNPSTEKYGPEWDTLTDAYRIYDYCFDCWQEFAFNNTEP